MFGNDESGFVPEDEKNNEHQVPPTISETDKEYIRQPDMAAFRELFCTSPETIRLFNKLVSNIRVIEEPEFDAGCAVIRTAITDFVGDTPFYIMTDRLKGKSPELLLPKLNIDLPNHIATFGRWLPEDFATASLPENLKVVVTDDVGYSGSRLGVLADEIVEKTGISKADVLVATVGMTSMSSEDILPQRGYKNLVYNLQIPLITEIFDVQELRLLAKTLYGRESLVSNFGPQVLTFLYYRVPDNFPRGLLKSNPIMVENASDFDRYFLIDDTKSGIYPPYRR